jgi:hypothetical protein
VDVDACEDARKDAFVRPMNVEAREASAVGIAGGCLTSTHHLVPRIAPRDGKAKRAKGETRDLKDRSIAYSD